MYKFSNLSFAKQLSFYLLSALVIAFIMIALSLANSLQQFVNNNANDQAELIAKNALVLFEKQIMRIECISKKMTNRSKDITYSGICDFSNTILKNHSFISGCMVHFNPSHPKFGHLGNIHTFRDNDKIASESNPVSSFDFYNPDTNHIVKKLSSGGYWISTKINQHSCLSLCNVHCYTIRPDDNWQR